MNGLSEEELKQYQNEIDIYKVKQKHLLIASFVTFGVALLELIALIVLVAVINNNTGIGVAAIVLMVTLPLSIAVGIGLIIIRSYIFGTKIDNRTRLINKAASLKREDKHPSDKNHKLGL